MCSHEHHCPGGHRGRPARRFLSRRVRHRRRPRSGGAVAVAGASGYGRRQGELPGHRARGGHRRSAVEGVAGQARPTGRAAGRRAPGTRAVGDGTGTGRSGADPATRRDPPGPGGQRGGVGGRHDARPAARPALPLPRRPTVARVHGEPALCGARPRARPLLAQPHPARRAELPGPDDHRSHDPGDRPEQHRGLDPARVRPALLPRGERGQPAPGARGRPGGGPHRRAGDGHWDDARAPRGRPDVAFLPQQLRRLGLGGRLRAAARLANRDGGDLVTVLDLLAAGRADQLARATYPHDGPDDAREALVSSVADAIRLAAARSDVARWRHSWSGPMQFVDRTGAQFPAQEIARLALEPSTVDNARAMLGGLNLAAARQVTRSAGAEGADVLGGLADVKVGKDAYDVLILDRGLVLVPSTGKSDEGRRRLLWLVQSAPVAELARRHWFLPYEEVAAAKIVKQVPVRVELTLHNGQSVSLHETWGGEDLGNESRKILKAAVAPFVRSGPD